MMFATAMDAPLTNARNAGIAGAALGLVAVALRSRTFAVAACGCGVATVRYIEEARKVVSRDAEVAEAMAAIANAPTPDIQIIEPEIQIIEKAPLVMDGPAPAVLDLTADSPGFVGDAGEEVRDPVTGLFNEKYFHIALENRISAARRQLRPVAVALLSLVIDGHEPVPGEAAKAADSVRSVLREADQAFRMDDGRFALVLEDTPENGAVWTVERLRRAMIGDREAIRAAGGRDPKVGEQSLRVHAGVACYPAHGFEAEEVVRLAEVAFDEATDWPGDRIEVAASVAD